MEETEKVTRQLYLDDLPPEILERIFLFVSTDPTVLKAISQVCPLFLDVVLKVPVQVHIPLTEPQLSWLVDNAIPVRSLTNREIAAYVGDQILALNLRGLVVARLVGYDYQSKKCEVTPHYLQILQFIRRRCPLVKRLDLNVDLIRYRGDFRFADLITSFAKLTHLSIHFSAHIELNQRILNSDDAQNLIDTVVQDLPSLKTLNIFICPPRRFHLASETLQELGIFKSDSIEVTHLALPALRKLRIHESTVELFRKILADRETSGSQIHKNLLSIIYDGCPNLQVLNGQRLPGSPRLGRRDWTRLVNKALIRQYRHALAVEELLQHRVRRRAGFEGRFEGTDQ